MGYGTLATLRKLIAPIVVVGVLLFVVLGTVTPQKLTAATGINQHINFQGRLFNSQGATVADAYYNVQFKIYQDGDGQTEGNATGSPAGTLKWTENHLVSASNGVQAKNGFLSVQLGSITPFGSSVDWNQDTLWLSMQVGNTASCTITTDFETDCGGDGEMVPMKRLSSTPYALNSGLLGGLTSAQFLQLGQGAQIDATNNNSIYINKTGASGNLIALQSSSADVFTLSATGDILFGANANHAVSVATAGAGIAGKNLTLAAGNAGTGAAVVGGNLLLQGGAGSGTGTSGSVVVKANTTDSAAAFQVQKADGTAVATADTTTGKLILGTAGASGLTGSLAFNYTGQTGSITLTPLDPSSTGYVINLPAANGTVCLQSSSACGFLSSSTGVQLQDATPGSPQTGHLNISGTGIFGTSVLSSTIDTATAATLNLGASGTPTTTGISLNQNTTVATGKTFTLAADPTSALQATTKQYVDNRNAERPGITWTQRTSAADYGWETATYGNGLFVAITPTSTTNQVMTSPDGVTWTLRASAANRQWKSVTYGNGLFVAVAQVTSGDKIMTSPDGINWTLRTTPEANNWRAVTYGNGRFVAVAYSGTNRTMMSTDGITWNAYAAASASSWQGIAYGNGTFVAVGGSVVMTSTDGTSWTPQTPATGSSTGWQSVTYGNGKFVAVATNGTGSRAMTSPDGVTWTAQTTPANNNWDEVTYGNGLFVATPYGGGTNTNFMTSPDGVTWTERVTGNSQSWLGLAYGNGVFVATAGDGTANRVMNSGSSISNAPPLNNIYQGGMTVYGNMGIGVATAGYKLDVAGDINISTGSVYRINGTQISSANLSNDSNLAKLNGTGPQTFTGNNKFTGTLLHQNASDTTTAFQIQSAAGQSILNVDTSGQYVINNGIRSLGNELENPGFEFIPPAGTTGTSYAGGWTGAASTEIISDSVNAQNGNGVMRINAVSNALTKYYAVIPGQQVYVEGYVKTTGTGGGGLFLEFTDKDKANASWVDGNYANPGSSYTLKTITTTVPTGKTFMRLATAMNSGATGIWYFDNIYMKRSSEQAAVLFKNAVDSATAFQVQNATGTSLLNIDTTSTGTVSIGTAAATTIQIGSTTLSSGTQAIYIGNNNTSGGTTNVTIGAGGSATGGTTTLQAKGTITFSTNGTVRGTFDTSNGLYLGNGVTAAAPNNFTLSGTGSSTTAVAGGALTVQGGNATVGVANGGNLTLSGGSGFGGGVNGLVVLGTPTFSTTSNDANCYTGSALVAASCTIAANSVNNSAAVIVGFSTTGQTASLPNPTISTAGRVLYVTAANASSDFTLSVNGGVGVGNLIAMRQNTTATMIWNGSAWTAAGASSSTTLQSAYDSTVQSAGGAELVVSHTSNTNGLTIRDSATNPVNGTLLSVQTSSAALLLSVNSNVTEYASNGGAETAGGTTTTFPANTWASNGSATVSRYVTAGNYIAAGIGSVSVGTTTAANDGVKNTLSTTLTANMSYNVSFTARLSSGTFTDMNVYYSINGTAASVSCATNQAIATSVWTKVNCAFTAPSSGMTSSNAILVRQTGSGTARTFYIDNLSVTIAADYNLATDGQVNDAGNFATNWSFVNATSGVGSVSRNTSDGNDASDSAGVTLTTGAANAGLRNKLSMNPLTGTLYRITVYAKLSSGTFTDFKIRYSRDGSTGSSGNYVDCVDYNTQTITTSAWTKVTCYITTDSTAATNPYINFVEGSSATRTFYVDTFTMALASDSTPNVQVGGGIKGGPVTLLTLDRGASAPIASDNNALLGSMYYDTTLGKLQCYEADGWGACGSSPDNVITISPEYTNAVMHGTDVGTMTSDLCSDTLNINDGSSGQDTICGSNETYNFYKWTSPQPSDQTYSIYVTYQLPSTFKSFASGQTAIMGRTDSTNATVQYQVYRNDSSSGLIACGPAVSVSTGSVSSWQIGTASGAADPSTCGFAANNSIVFKIDVIASQNANAYVGNLNFTFSNK